MQLKALIRQKYISLSFIRSHLIYIASRNNAQIWINSDIWLYLSLIYYSAHAWHIISEMSSATEITTSRRGDVTNARDKQTVLCPLLISNYWTGGYCELKCAWFYCLLRSYKSTLQLCGLSEHVDVAFITNQKWVWPLSDCYVLWKVLVQAVHAVFQESFEYYIQCSLYMHNMLLRRLIIPHMRNKWRVETFIYSRLHGNFSFYRIHCSASLFCLIDLSHLMSRHQPLSFSRKFDGVILMLFLISQ